MDTTPLMQLLILALVMWALVGIPVAAAAARARRRNRYRRF
jgi:hypothetical protein